MPQADGQRPGHVVAVADEDQRLARRASPNASWIVSRSASAWHGWDVVGQAVDDRDRRVVARAPRRSRARRSRSTRASTYWLMIAGEVGDALAARRGRRRCREEDAGAAELGDRRLEADARPQRRLLEDQAERSRPGRSGGAVAAARAPPSAAAASREQVAERRRRRGRTGRGSDAWEHRRIGSRTCRPIRARDSARASASALRTRRRGSSQPSSICSSVRVRAGSRRSTVPCVQLISSRRFRHSATTRRAVDRQLDADHRALDADLVDRAGTLGRSASKRPRNRSPICAAAVEQAVVLDRLDRRPGRPRQAIGLPPNVAACVPGLSFSATSGCGDQPAARDAAGQRLGQRQDVGLDAPVLVGEPLAGPAHAGLHLVEDQQQPVLVAELAQPFEVAGAAAR